MKSFALVLLPEQMALLTAVMSGLDDRETLADFARVMTLRVNVGKEEMPEYTEAPGILEDYFSDAVLTAFRAALERVADWTDSVDILDALLMTEISQKQHDDFFAREIAAIKKTRQLPAKEE